MTRKKGRPVSGSPHNAKAEMWLLGRLSKRQAAAPAAELPADRTEAEQHHRPGRRLGNPMVRDRNRATERACAVVVTVDDQVILTGSNERVVQTPRFNRP